MRTHFRIAVAISILAGGSPSLADGWFVAEAPAAIAISDAQQGVFRPGVMPAFGVYADNNRIALGLRVRAGILRDGPTPAGNRLDPGVGGLTTVGVAARIGVRGAWIELVGGGGLTGRDVVPSVEGGVGFLITTGSVAIGPAIRYARVISRNEMSGLGTAELVLVGIDVQVGKQRPRRPLRERSRVPEPPRIVATPVARDPDVEAIVEREPSCAREPDGCRLTDDLVLVHDRIVLDERVMFDVNRARVKTRGRKVVSELVRIWQAHPEWTVITIEGHADVRGSDDYNVWLSQLRADRVRKFMVERGADPDRIKAIGFGRARPRTAGHSERDHQRNRRVEFAIDRSAGGVR